MLIEGLVGVVALIAAARLAARRLLCHQHRPVPSVPNSWPSTLTSQMVAEHRQPAPQIEQQVGGARTESLRGRTGGAVTLAVGMARDLLGDALPGIDWLIKYWYHFAIMFEALFILTTIDTGTRIARFLLQEALGKICKPLDRPTGCPARCCPPAGRTAAGAG